MKENASAPSPAPPGIAIIGMAGRFPGAADVASFWRNLRAGVESISHFTDAELEDAFDASVRGDPNFVRARSVIEGVEEFDAGFFGMHAREAELTDPQHRVFLECAWHALEDAGYDPAAYKDAIGVFAGCSMSTYFLRNVLQDRAAVELFTSNYQVGSYGELIGALPDVFATRVSYKLGLRGPAMTVQTACSTSLVAIAQACQSLLLFESDMALAGGVSITLPQRRGYLAVEGAMVSPTGRVRTFDAKADGTVFGSGAGVVLLKRVEDAIADGDHIYAVIRGAALNNDGAARAGFTAPSVNGQWEVIAAALANAEVDARSISYVECHGTATPLGDPIEVAGLTRAFRASTEDVGFCALGSVKPNVGHLDAAAGVTGLIKTALALQDRQLPATLFFETPNPHIAFEGGPFYVNDTWREWPRGDEPRRAGVSAFGVGGTNAHAVLEEAPLAFSEPTRRPAQIICVSARSAIALETARRNLAAHLQSHPELTLADVAYTTQAGRRAFSHRAAVAVGDLESAAAGLESGKGLITGEPRGARTLAFMFPGQGAQYPAMGLELYRTETVFRESMRRSAEILRPALGADLCALLYGETGERADAEGLQATEIAQPALFAVGYALAALWRSIGVTPQMMIGHSVGEFVGACLAGVFSHEDALRLIAARGRLMQEMPRGSMMAVRLPEAELTPFLQESLALAAINGPKLCVAAGPDDAIAELDAELSARGVMTRRLHTSHAFHSPMMEPAAKALREQFAGVRLAPPAMRLISSTTGEWLTASEATSPDYWATHCRAPVRFAAGLATLLREAGPDAILLEAGPGVTLSTLARQGGAGSAPDAVLASLPDAAREASDSEVIARSTAQLWCAGVPIDWRGVHSDAKRRRVSLPAYPFERVRHWIDAPPVERVNERQAPAPSLSTSASAEVRELFSRDAAFTGTILPQASLFETSFPEISPPMTAAPITPTQSDSTAASAATSASLHQRVVELFEALSGEAIADLAPETTFLEMGFDSLFLSQATQQLQREFKAKLTFRQLLGDLSTIPALTAHLEANLPPELHAPQAATAVPTALTQSAPAPAAAAQPSLSQAASNAPPAPGSAGVEQVIREQLDVMSRLMAQQLEALRGAPVTGALPAPSAMSAPPQPAAGAAAAAAKAPISAPISLAVSAPTANEPKSRFEMIAASRSAPPVDMNERQQRALAELIARFNERTAQSKRMTAQYRSVLADPRAASGFRSEWKDLVYPVVSDRAKGSRIYDVDGNSYIDLVNGYGQTFFGHAAPFVVDAVAEQLREGFAIGPQSALAGRVAALFAEMTGNERVTFCNTGSEAVMAAMRIARTVTGRNTIATFTGDYHGQFDEVLVKGTLRSGVARAIPAAAGIPGKSVENMVVLPYGAPESLEWIRAHADDLAAVLVEPVQSRHPELRPVEFLREIRAITESSGSALIFDEVVTGFRMHPGGMQALFDIRADLATYGKVVGGGLPVGILAGKAAFMDALDGGMWSYGDDSYPEVGMTFFAGTFVRHPLVMAAVWAVLNHLKEQGPPLQERVSARTAALVKRLNEFVEKRGLDFQIETFGSLFFFNLSNVSRYAGLFYPHMLERGVYVQEHYPCFLTTAHSEADIAAIAEAFEDAIITMQKSDFMPAPPGLGPEPETDVPLTEAQTEIWLSAQLSDEASCAFNESVTLRLRGRLDRNALTKALNEVIARHDALRAVFQADGQRMRILPSLELDLIERDLERTSRPAAQDAWRDLLAHDARTAFDLVNGPLVRAQLVRFAADDHALVVTAHHIICDGWSFNVIIDEVTKLYEAGVSGAAAELPTPLSFVRYGAEERARQAREGAVVEAFWLPQFTPPPPALDLPTDHPRQAQKSFAGATLTRRIDPELTQLFRKAAARQGCTLFVGLLAAFETLLARLAGQEEVVVGIPAAGQSLAEGDNLVGHCVNFLPLRGRWTAETTMAEHLAATGQIVLAAYENQSFTLGTLVRKMALPREAGRRPLVEAQFNLERIADKIHVAGLEIETQSNPKSAVIFDLFFNVTEQDGGLRVDCDYNSGLFDESTIERWIGHYRTLLGEIAASPAQPISALPLISTEERHWLTQELNRSAANDLDLRPVHELIAAQAARTPGAVAARFADAALSYRELDERANRLANHLRGVVSDPSARIGVATERSLDMLIALLAIMKTGCAYVPLDPSHPAARLRLVLDNAAVSAVVCDNAFMGAMAPGIPVVRIDADAGLIASRPSSAPAVESDASRPCYVIFTSGSTGAPKGVEIAHRSVANLLWSIARTLDARPSDVLVAATTISFDIAALELYLPLITGGSVVIASRDDVRGGFGLATLIEKTQATIVQATPSLWRILTEAGFAPRRGLRMLCGGEALPRDLADTLLKNGGELWNVYGPTETTIWSSIGRVSPAPAPITIGSPVLNTELYVLDKAHQLTPVGVVGELFIGGAGLAIGYFRRPDLNAAAFLQISVGDLGPQRLYRTGDLARRLPDGGVEILGRVDSQIKLRGFRIELEEIEAVMRGYPGVLACAAAVQTPVGGTPRLIGYTVAAADCPIPSSELSAYAAQRLPDYMIPAIWMRLVALPLTPNGKLDRKSLPQPDLAQSAEARIITPPRDALEAALATIWREVLQINEVGVHDNIFALGADSIHLFRIAARMMAQNLGLEARHLMRFPTIAQLALAASAEPSAEGKSAAAPSLKSFRRGQVKESSA
ncbi:Amino acid adenylation domain protein [Methylocella tundrae]|uniref:Amino acid adenylation domain protein n=1 Tax=Methylocella tundrae TaxID=227605 RepID=A0A8B6M2A6_METTU|nr:non-ribosomal peptide synthetase/type I polyketide synthase [Methylocella tundrae]VTZ49147.1 Amino acid adenylation domain protein [Methylocella tundrae]